MKLAIEIRESGLRVGLYRRRLNGWVCQQRADLAWRLDSSQAGMAEQLVATLRPSLLAWGVKPDTAVLVAPTGDIGGVLYEPGVNEPLVDEKVEALLTQRLPYPKTELAWVVRNVEQGAATCAQIAWIPKGWLTETKDALARLALRLEEVFPLPFLISMSIQQPVSKPHLWINATPQSLAMCTVHPGGVAESMAVVGMSQAAAKQRFELARYAITSGKSLPVLLSAETAEANDGAMVLLGSEVDVTPIPAADIVERLFRAWMNGESGWWQAPSRDWLIARSMPWLIGLSVVLLASIAYLTWDRQHLIDQNNKADDAANKLRPAHRRLEAEQRQLFQMTGQLLEAESYEHGKPPLDPLAVVTDLLPQGAWVTRYHFDGQSYQLEGKGATNADMVRLLGGKGLNITPIQPTMDGSKKQGDGAVATVSTFALKIEQVNAKKTKPTN
jgi:hypothetical protein